MKRLLLLLALVSMAVGMNAQSLSVYVNDNSGSDTNIRNAPKGRVVQRIPKVAIAMLLVETPKNGWWRICDDAYFYVTDRHEGHSKLTGSRTGYWIHSSVLAVGTRNYGGQTLYLYQQPNESSKKVYTIREEIELRPIEVRGDWVKCTTLWGNNVGWIQAEWLCGNALTNCN